MTPSAGQPVDLGDDVGERAADLGAAHRRDDAERAGVVAADLDRDPGVVRGLAARRQRAGEHRLVVEHGFVEDLGDRARRGGPDRAARPRGGRCACPAPRRRTAPCARTSRGPSAPGSRPRRSGDRRACSFHGFSQPRLPYSLLSAFSRMQQVLSTTTSASASSADRDIAVGFEQARRCARSRARSSGTRRCGRRSCGSRRAQAIRMQRCGVTSRTTRRSRRWIVADPAPRASRRSISRSRSVPRRPV